MIVLQPKRKSVRGRRILLSEKRTTHAVSEEFGSASLSREGVTEIGGLPAAAATAAWIASRVTGMRQCCKLSSIAPYLRGTLEIRYDIQGEACSIIALLKKFPSISLFLRAVLLPLVGQKAKPVFVGKTFANSDPSAPSFDLIRV